MILILKEDEQLKNSEAYNASVIIRVMKSGRFQVEKTRFHDFQDFELYLNEGLQEYKYLLSKEVLRVMMVE